MKINIGHIFPIIAAVASFGANAADQYVFGYSNFNSGNHVTVNESTNLSLLDSGWYFQNGTHNPSNQNYIVGNCTSCALSGEYRNWFVFDLSGVSGTAPVLSASFSLYSNNVTLTSGNYYLNDVNTPINDLVSGTGGVNAFNDLGTGSSYGYRFYQSATDSNQFYTISLNSTAILGLNEAIAAGAGKWAIGGAFAAGNIPLPPVPEPETYAMLLAGIGLMGAVARRRKTKLD